MADEVKFIPGEKKTPGKYEVLTRTCVWGDQGEVIDLTLTEGQEQALLLAGTVKRATIRPVKAAARKENSNG